jgi:hypothetical protein
VSLGGNEAHEVRAALRAWRDSEWNLGFVDPFTFIAFCEDENIDTNYLRLLRELAGCGNGKEVGRLPLKELKCFGTEDR